MSLVSVKDVQSAAGLQKWGMVGRFLAWLLYTWAEIPALNGYHDRSYDHKGRDFFDALIKDLQIKYELHPDDLKRIPKEGPFVVVSNHPLGALDGILMTLIISEVRPDFKIMGNFLLSRIEPIKDLVIPVNPFDSRKEIYSSASGMKGAMQHIKNGGGLGIFPAGEVSRKNFRTGEIYDRRWQMPVMKLLKKLNVPVIPMYFHAKNGRVFYRWGKIHPDFHTVLLPVEMMRPRIKPIKIRIGKAILPKLQSDYEDTTEYGQFLRRKVYMLKSYYDDRKKLSEFLKIPKFLRSQKVFDIVDETPTELICQEIEELRNNEENFLFKNNQYEVFFAKADKIPKILREIGRLRELTFRPIGEGTNQPIDLDMFDNTYHHLFLWDDEHKRIVGAYRLGLGKELYEKSGIEGFYINTLFNFEPDIHPFFKKCIEMGRAFVVEDYQQRPLPLFLLWKGIVYVCLRNPYYHFLMGGVSISNKFSNFSKSLMIDFMKSHYYDSFVGQFVKPKNDFIVKLTEQEKELFFGEAEEDINKLDKLIDELEPSSLRIPVLIKKYFKQNAKVIAFNVDPKFNDAIDGLMYIRIKDLPESTIKPVFDEIQEELNKKSIEMGYTKKQ